MATCCTLFRRARIAAALATAGAMPAQAPAAAAGEPPAHPRVLWHVPGKWGCYQELPLHKGVLWAAGDTLTAHDVQTGKELHRATLEGSWYYPVLSGGLVFARHQDGSLHVFTLDLSRELWSMPLAQSWHTGCAHGDMYFTASGNEVVAITGGKEHWKVDLGARVDMRPATDGVNVYAGTADGRVVGIGLQTGEIAWEYENGAEFGTTSPVVDGGTLFMSDRGVKNVRKAHLNAFDAQSGRLLWSTEFGATGFSLPYPHGDRVWAGFGVTVASFDRKTGVLDWENRIVTGRNPFGQPGMTGSAIVFGNLDGNLYVHDAATRALRWRFEVGTDKQAQVAGWAMHDGVLIVTSTRGVLGIGETPGAPPVEPGFVLRLEEQAQETGR